MKKNSSVFLMGLAMLIFGTIGVFRRYIPLSSSLIALCRGAMGMLVLLLIQRIRRKKQDLGSWKKKGLLLFFSGVLMGANWILLFEAYRFTTVAVATMCYYMAPLLILLVSPLFGEKLTAGKVLCALFALLGMVLLSGILEGEISGLRGIFLSLISAAIYASIVLLNKGLTDVPAEDRTVIQLGSSVLVLLPYVLLTGGLEPLGHVSWFAVVMLLLLGVVHTGIAYWLYFTALQRVSAQTAALISYIDPITACLLSVTILQEPMSPLCAIGIVIVLLAIAGSELNLKSKKNGSPQ